MVSGRECRLRLRRQPLLAVAQGFESLCYWALRDLMQVGGYRPQFRPHRGVIGTPGRYPHLVPAAFVVLAVSLIPAQDISRVFAILALQPTWARSDHTPMRSHREDRAVNDRLSWSRSMHSASSAANDSYAVCSGTRSSFSISPRSVQN